VKEYLSFGAGVNSVALLLLLQDQGREFESVFSDHRCEYPETYEYLDYLKDLGFEITRLDPKVSWKGKWNSLYDYFFFHGMIRENTNGLQDKIIEKENVRELSITIHYGRRV